VLDSFFCGLRSICGFTRGNAERGLLLGLRGFASSTRSVRSRTGGERVLRVWEVIYGVGGMRGISEVIGAIGTTEVICVRGVICVQ
jgi:hypothetical protein